MARSRCADRPSLAARGRLMVSACLIAVGCASSTTDGVEEPLEDEGPAIQTGRGEVAPIVTYAPTAEGNYREGEKAFEEGQLLAAQRFYGYVRTKFPYSRFAVLSALRVADCQFERRRFLEAIDSYQNFVRLHATHPKAHYARFRIGRAYVNQIPENFFMLPPAHEKDQAAVRDSEKALRAFTEMHPDSEHMEEAQALLEDVRSRLMAHERYVADFYRNEGRVRAYVGRLEVIRDKFPDVGLDDALLLEITEAWASVGEADKARAALAELKAKFPESEVLDDATRAVDKIPPAPAEENSEPAAAAAP